MTQTLYAMTTDPDRTWEIATLTPREVHVESLFPRDPLPNGPVVGLIIDLDHVLLNQAGRNQLVEQAPKWVARFPVAVLSFNLEDRQVIALQAKGVVVSHHLNAKVVKILLGLPPGGAGSVLPAA